ncbi:hypothetical protein BGX29_003346, partial [Mortierella sp. GBA35]
QIKPQAEGEQANSRAVTKAKQSDTVGESDSGDSDEEYLASGSEAEELPDVDEEGDMEEVELHVPEVYYNTLVRELVNTAVIHKSQSQNEKETITIKEQELAFAREVDETSQGHANNTQASYKSTYRPYKDFCDKYYAIKGTQRYEVSAVKAARFLKEAFFNISTAKYIPTHIVKETKVFMPRKVIEGFGIPISGEGVKGIFDFAFCK